LWSIIEQSAFKYSLSPVHIFSLLKRDPKTVRKYIWLCIYILYDQLAKTDLINWGLRYDNWSNPEMSVILDVTECRIQSPLHYEWEYYSVKEKKHTLKYEVAITLSKPPARGHEQRIFNKNHYSVRQAIERCNKRLKQFHCLKNTWRHDIDQHPYIFALICYITQLNFIYQPLTK